MDVKVADELVAMRHEELAHARGPLVVREQRRLARREAVRTGWLRAAMWAFGAGVVAPKGERQAPARVAQQECVSQV